jgi:glutamate/tyrosine decarboxylase-like PLP-dependent enzyme
MNVSVIEQLKQLEKLARPLEPGETERAFLLNQVGAYANQFINRIDTAPAYTASENGRLPDSFHINENGAAIEELLPLLHTHVNTPGVAPTSDRFLGYIPGGALYHSALGDFLADLSNKYAGYYFPSPGAVQLENMLLDWMAGIVGYPDGALGSLTSGGSLAHLTAVVTAREARGIAGERIGTAVVYLTAQTHHSVNKALRIAGLNQCVRRFIPVDDHYRLETAALLQAIVADKQMGLNPWLVIGTAGTTNTGAIDPLPEIAQIAQAHGLWLHVDGAYGAFFALCDEGRQKLAGMEQSDSIIMDPHKTLFLPYGTGTVLVKDGRNLFNAFAADAAYMQDGAENDVISPADLSPELTRHFRGLRMWLPLKLVGAAPFRAALAEKLLLARYFYERLQEIDGFEVGPPPDLAVVTYRYVPERGDANEFNERLMQALLADGRIFISSTRLGDKFVLRTAVGVYRTHLDAVEQALAVLAETARKLED